MAILHLIVSGPDQPILVEVGSEMSDIFYLCPPSMAVSDKCKPENVTWNQVQRGSKCGRWALKAGWC